VIDGNSRKDARWPSSGHNGQVKLRTGTAIAFGVGFLLGARAGRERYLQIVRFTGGVGRSAPVTGTATLIGSKVKAVAVLGTERLKDSIGVRLGWRDGDQAADAIALDLAEDLAIALNSRRQAREGPTAPFRPAGQSSSR
jgi:hypothetical protein